MTLKSTHYLLGIVMATVLAIFSSASILTFTTPNNAGPLNFFALYVSIFLSVCGIGLTLGLGLRHKLFHEHFTPSFKASLRQSVLISVFVVSSLMLQADRLLYWWVEVSILLLLVVIEILFNL